MYTPIIGTLGFVLSADRRRVLLVHRSRADDPQAGKWNGLGGKLEPGEDVHTCLCRELNEEAGLEVTSARLRGTISWPGVGAEPDWFGLVFLVDGWQGEPPDRNDDGPLVWHEVDRLAELPMWESDRQWLPLVFGDGPPFHLVLPNLDGDAGPNHEVDPGSA